MPGLSLKRNFVWTFIGNAIYQGTQWLNLIVLAKLVTTDAVGIYSLALAIATPITQFSNLQLNIALVTDAQDEYSFGDYLHIIIITSIISSCITAGVAFFSCGETGTLLVVIMVGVSQSVISIRGIYLAFMQKHERMDIVSTSYIILGCLSLVVFSTIIYLSRELLLAIAGTVLVRILVFSFHDRIRARKLSASRNGVSNDIMGKLSGYKALIKLALLSLPLGITIAVITLNGSIPRYFLVHFHDKATLGFYAPMASLLALGSMVIYALAQPASPRLAKYFAYNKPAFKRLLAKLIGIGFGLGACGLLITFFFGKYILTFFFTPEYAAYYREFNWIMLSGAFAFAYSFMGYGITAARYFKLNVALALLNTIPIILGSCLLIPKYGIKGAAWTSTITYAWGLIFTSIVIIFILRKQPDITSSKTDD